MLMDELVKKKIAIIEDGKWEITAHTVVMSTIRTYTLLKNHLNLII